MCVEKWPRTSSCGVSVFEDRRASRCDLGQMLRQVGCVLTVEQVVQVRVAVEMVEVLQQREVERLLQHRVGLLARQPRCEVDGDLLVTDRRLQRRLVTRIQTVDGPLLLLLDPARHREGALDLDVVGMPRELVPEDDRFDLDPVHQDHAATRVRVDVELVVRLRVELAPASELLLDRNAALFERIEGHGQPRSDRQGFTDYPPSSADRTRPEPYLKDGRTDPEPTFEVPLDLIAQVRFRSEGRGAVEGNDASRRNDDDTRCGREAGTTRSFRRPPLPRGRIRTDSARWRRWRTRRQAVHSGLRKREQRRATPHHRRHVTGRRTWTRRWRPSSTNGASDYVPAGSAP